MPKRSKSSRKPPKRGPKPPMALSPDEVSTVSGDGLEVVFDLKEDKKNRLYEVITVMSDDETPDQTTYERVYAEQSDQRVVLDVPPAEEKKENNLLLGSDLLGELVKETNVLKNKERDSLPTEDVSKIAKEINPANPPIVETVDSDDDIICVSVVDPKTKAEQNAKEIKPANPPIVEIVDSDDDIIWVTVVAPKTKAEQKKNKH